MALKKDELANPNSCLNRAGEFEPVFVLRANDPTAPDAVRDWAYAYRQRKLNAAAFNEPAQSKFREAIALADLMDAWREHRG